MAEIVATVEISRRPDEVFAYAADPMHHPAWVGSVVSARRQGDAPLTVGSKVLVTRRLGPRALATIEEMTELNPPTTWANRGIAGLPVIAVAKGKVEPLDDGTRSRVTIILTFEGHGIGKLLAPILARRQARQLPKDGQNLKQLLERDAQAPTPHAQGPG
ncbi:MAG TPA: SRPBCC family protein [Streptosporangiaceae bacterium]|nr:SRPBCC family protein [Streptosporangiaceae bacterium]